MGWSITADVEEFDEAVEAFRARVPITAEMAEALNDFAHDRAFTIAGVAQLDIVQQVHDSLLKAISEGTSFEDWQKQIEDILLSAWGRADSPRIETIFRNATMQSYNAGRWRQMTEPNVLRFRPYGLFDGIDDDRQTPVCDAWDGKVMRLEDFVNLGVCPQLHHRCRSSIRNIRESEALRRGVTEEIPVERPAAGFGKRPDTAEPWHPDGSRYSANLRLAHAQKTLDLQAAPSASVEPDSE